MLKMVHQLTLAGLALVLFGGLLSPVLAQAASTDAGGTETTNTSSTTTNYPISSIDGLYATYLSANGSKKVYAFPQDPKSYTKADFFGNDGGDSFIKGTDAPHGIASTIRSKMVTYVKDGISLTPNETVGELMNNNTPNTPEEISQARNTMYWMAWMLKMYAEQQTNSFNSNAALHEYTRALPQRPLPSLKPLSEDDLSSLITTMGQLLCPTLYISDDPTSFPTFHDLAQINPEASASALTTLMSTPVINFLTKQGDGYSLDYKIFTILTTADTFFLGPESSTSTATSQPVTVHYVDDQGNTLKPDKTLTGALGAAYEADPLTIDGYTLSKTTGTESGTFSGTAQSVTYTYTTVSKGAIISPTQKVGLYATPDFSSNTRKQWYAKKSRMNRPMFRVTGTAKSKNGTPRYQVIDVNSQGKTAGQTGYMTTNTADVTPTYYATTHNRLTVINPGGINAYGQQNLTQQKAHYQQGQVLTIKNIVNQGLTTRFVLNNGQFITANKKLVQAGTVKLPKRVQAKTAVNRYDTANLTQRNHHYAKRAHATFTVQGWAYSNTNNFSKRDTLRYKVAGGYMTANTHFVRAVD